MSNFVISQCRLLFVHDQAGQKVLQQQAPDVRVTMVPHGPYSLFATNTSGQKSAKIFLFFGRIEEYKGIATLLQAWPQVAQTLPDWKLIIAGQGDLTPYADQLQTSSIEVRNYYLADDEVAELFGQAGVVVLPYHDATQSGVLMIAAAMAKPIIASRVGAIPQVVIDGQSGMLVSPGSVSELANAMIYAGSNLSAVQSFGHQLQHSTSQVGDWIEAARRHQVAYKTILP